VVHNFGELSVSNKLNIPAKEKLLEIYNKNKSISKTAKYYNTSNPTMRSWLIYHDISRYSQKEASLYDTFSKKIDIPGKLELENIYTRLSIKDIQNLYGVGQETIYSWLTEYNIPKINISTKVSQRKTEIFNKRFNLSKEQIEQDYSVLQCMGSLAEKYKCSNSTIKKLFKIFNIEAKFAKSSVGQNEVYDFIVSLGMTAHKNDRKIIGPLELDIVIPDKKIAIEYCGIYYHSETWGGKSKFYHYNKLKLCQEVEYDLYTIFESEWKTKKDIVKSIIRHKLGCTEKKIHARKTVFKKIDYAEIKKFEHNNHLQGSRPGSEYYGLYHENDLVMSINIGKSRFNKNYKHELIRMTSKQNTSIPGGMKKLFHNAKIKECITYADLRYGTGKSYGKSGFTYVGKSNPNYFYFHKSNHEILYSRLKFQKSKIPNVDANKSEYQNMLELNYDRIWDCGNAIFSI